MRDGRPSLISPVKHKTALQVSVSEERGRDLIGNERLDRVAGANHVFIFVKRRAVDKLDAREVHPDGAGPAEARAAI
jgi:hypothetical protein